MHDPEEPPAGHEDAGHEDAAREGAAREGAARPARQQDIRVSDQERNQVVALLSEHAAAGRLTLAELEDRAAQAYCAKTQGELARIIRDLPELPAEPPPRRVPRRWFVAILGGSDRRGRFRLSGSVHSVSVIGGDNIDLRNAEIDGDQVTINAYSVLGGPDIYLPDSVGVEMSGVALLGGDSERGSQGQPRPGAPSVRIRSFSLMGGTKVWHLPAQARDLPLREARRVAREHGRRRHPR